MYQCEYKKERSDINELRDSYLEWTERYKDDEDEVYYQEETWVFKTTVASNILQSVTRNDEHGIDYKVHFGSKGCLIVSHLRSTSHGLLKVFLLLSTDVNKADHDYHSEMNETVFLK